MLGQRRRLWPNIIPAPGQRALFARFLFVAEKLDQVGLQLQFAFDHAGPLI